MAAGVAFAKAKISEQTDTGLAELVEEASVSTRGGSLVAVGRSGSTLLTVPAVSSVTRQTGLLWRVEADGRVFLVERKRRKG